MKKPPKYKIVDLFSGAGGLELGFEQAGYEIVFSTDFDEYCEKVHINNRPQIPFLRMDIHDLDDNILDKYINDENEHFITYKKNIVESLKEMKTLLIKYYTNPRIGFEYNDTDRKNLLNFDKFWVDNF